MEDEERVQDEVREHSGRRRFWLALLVMFSICGFAVYRSALFRLERVQITGAERLSQSDILEMAGLSPGMLRWETSAERVEQRLLAEPGVRTASVSWSGNRLVIDLAERQPLALLQYQGRFYALLDEEGYILGQRMLDEGDRLPVVAGLTITRALRGQQLSHQGLLDALTVIAWTAPSLRSQISEVQVREDRYIRLFMVGGATVDWGVLPETVAKRDVFIRQQLTLFGDFWDRVPRAKWAKCQVDLRVAGDLRGIGCD